VTRIRQYISQGEERGETFLNKPPPAGSSRVPSLISPPIPLVLPRFHSGSNITVTVEVAPARVMAVVACHVGYSMHAWAKEKRREGIPHNASPRRPMANANERSVSWPSEATGNFPRNRSVSAGRRAHKCSGRTRGLSLLAAPPLVLAPRGSGTCVRPHPCTAGHTGMGRRTSTHARTYAALVGDGRDRRACHAIRCVSSSRWLPCPWPNRWHRGGRVEIWLVRADMFDPWLLATCHCVQDCTRMVKSFG